MWEAIRANHRRSRLLIGLMGAILIGLGYLIGLALFGPSGGAVGALSALAIWTLLLVIALLGGEQVILMSAGARRVRKEDAPRLWNVVEEMTLASGLGKMPKVYIIDNYTQNAFATGRKPEEACVVVTAGLIRRLSRDELQGVIAHEIAHIKNYDIRFLTIASVMVGSIVLLSDLFRRSLWFGGGRRAKFKGGPQVQLAILGLTLLAAILAPVVAQLLYFACSRKREYLADASAARFTRNPEGLASALERISKKIGFTKKGMVRTLAPMYIVNPLQAAVSSAGLFSTHPPTKQRVRILRSMGGNAGWIDYEKAYRRVVGSEETCLDSRTLRSEKSISARSPTPEPEPAREAIGRAREVGDLLDRLVNVLLISCACGVRIKIPPLFRQGSIRCTRCGREHGIPRAEEQVSTEEVRRARPLRYRRQCQGWESFRCTCGKVQQLSPAFRVKTVTCRGCRRRIEITN